MGNTFAYANDAAQSGHFTDLRELFHLELILEYLKKNNIPDELQIPVTQLRQSTFAYAYKRTQDGKRPKRWRNNKFIFDDKELVRRLSSGDSLSYDPETLRRGFFKKIRKGPKAKKVIKGKIILRNAHERIP